ncbi:MAG: hypothetical protein QG611_577, partial [Bacteroidota bacterium]|nr:hypothetical protein [Bacteroidota bacterium]
MKNKILIASSFILLFPGAISMAQEKSSDLSISLKEA